MLIVCNVNMFSLNQDIMLGDKTYKVPLDSVGQTISQLCGENEEINEIHLYGDEQFLSGIVHDIHFSYNSKYGKNLNNLKIEVNKYDLSC